MRTILMSMLVALSLIGLLQLCQQPALATRPKYETSITDVLDTTKGFYLVWAPVLGFADDDTGWAAEDIYGDTPASYGSEAGLGWSGPFYNYAGAKAISGVRNTVPPYQRFDHRRWIMLTRTFHMATTANKTVSIDLKASLRGSLVCKEPGISFLANWLSGDRRNLVPPSSKIGNDMFKNEAKYLVRYLLLESDSSDRPDVSTPGQWDDLLNGYTPGYTVVWQAAGTWGGGASSQSLDINFPVLSAANVNRQLEYPVVAPATWKPGKYYLFVACLEVQSSLRHAIHDGDPARVYADFSTDDAPRLWFLPVPQSRGLLTESALALVSDAQ